MQLFSYQRCTIFTEPEKTSTIVLLYDQAANWYKHIKLSVIDQRYKFEAIAEQFEKCDTSLDNLFLVQCSEKSNVILTS